MRHNALIALPALLLAGCATTATTSPGGQPVREPVVDCDASVAQDRIGQRATTELGTGLLATTGATQLRWVPPRTAVTMDFRPDRLTVSYDDDMMIDRITCG